MIMELKRESMNHSFGDLVSPLERCGGVTNRWAFTALAEGSGEEQVSVRSVPGLRLHPRRAQKGLCPGCVLGTSQPLPASLHASLEVCFTLSGGGYAQTF